MATAKPKTRDNKVTRLIIPALYDTPGLTINEVVDSRTGKPVEALYFYDALKAGVIEQMDEPVRTGKRGRPARRWKLTKATRDRVRKQRQRAEKYLANGGAELGEAIADLEAVQAEHAA
jgi:hypothetical protein